MNPPFDAESSRDFLRATIQSHKFSVYKTAIWLRHTRVWQRCRCRRRSTHLLVQAQKLICSRSSKFLQQRGFFCIKLHAVGRLCGNSLSLCVFNIDLCARIIICASCSACNLCVCRPREWVFECTERLCGFIGKPTRYYAPEWQSWVFCAQRPRGSAAFLKLPSAWKPLNKVLATLRKIKLLFGQG